jgi:hypothetical protein
MASDLYVIIFTMKSWVIMGYLALTIKIYISVYNQKFRSFEASLLI